VTRVSGKEVVVGGDTTSTRVMLSRWSGEEGTLGMCGGERRLSLLVREALDI